MFNSFTDTCRYLDFPGEAIESLCTQYEKIRLCPTTADYICKVFEEYSSNSLTESLYTHQVNFEKLCQDIDVHSYSSQMIFYICLVPALWDKYLERGLPEEIFRDSMADLRCKLFECYRLYGIWGSFVAVWFSRFFNFTLYGIGRLEFAPYSCDFDFTLTKNGRSYCIKKGDPVIDVHIPSRGRLPHEEVLDSYKRALEFFKLFVCQLCNRIVFCADAEGDESFVGMESRISVAHHVDFEALNRFDNVRGDEENFLFKSCVSLDSVEKSGRAGAEERRSLACDESTIVELDSNGRSACFFSL